MGSSIVAGSTAILFMVLASVSCTIPDYIRVCPHDHQNFTGCIIDSIENLRPLLKTGIPDIKVLPLEPLDLGRIAVNSLGEGSRIATNLSDIRIWGASSFKILKLTHKLRKSGHNFQFGVVIPQVHVEGQYEIDSKILFLDLQGKGPFNANFTDYHIECAMKGNRVEKNGANHLVFEPIQCNAAIGDIKIFLENLFNGNQVLGRATNDVINENSQVLFHEIRPRIAEKIRERFTEIANQITDAFTYEELFP